VANNNYPQITSVTSEALQAQIRALLPSQEGFGTDLMAQNVIVPIIDLTSAAEGSTVPEFLQTSINFGNATAFDVTNTTTTIINNTGFYRVFGTWTCSNTFGGGGSVNFSMTDGLATKVIYKNENQSGSADQRYSGTFDFNVFCATGISVTAFTSSAACFIQGSTRPIADINGVLINPVGFTPQ
jgi:hypothetical protein